MKMQELIGEFRDEVPKLAKATDKSREACRKAMSLFRDYYTCESPEAKNTLAGMFREAMAEFSSAFRDVDAGVGRLAELNGGYTRVLGPRGPKTKDDPRQPDLPGLERAE